LKYYFRIIIFTSSLIAPALSKLNENSPNVLKTEAETEFNTMEPQVGTVIFQEKSEPARQVKPPTEKVKNAQMSKFISDVALNYAMQNPDLVENKETFVGMDLDKLMELNYNFIWEI